ncbi:hypothetical protein D3C77_625640 [compost metagenome]
MHPFAAQTPGAVHGVVANCVELERGAQRVLIASVEIAVTGVVDQCALVIFTLLIVGLAVQQRTHEQAMVSADGHAFVQCGLVICTLRRYRFR